MKILPFQKNVITFKSKASTEKRKTGLTANNSFDIPKNDFSFLSKTCVFLTKNFFDFLEFLPFQKNAIIFQSRLSTEKDNTVLTYNNTLTYCKQRLIFSE